MAHNNNDELYKLALSFIPGIGAVHARNLVSYLGGVKEVFRADRRSLRRVPGIGAKRAADILHSDALSRAENSLKMLAKQDVRLLFYLDDDYPSKLKEFAGSPLVLYIRGKLKLEHNRMVAIVGTRRPTPWGKECCERIVHELKAYGCYSVSGLAYGIDSIVHDRSIAGGIPTIGILGSGLDRIYPYVNRRLAERISDQGCLISEFPFGTKPDRENFPRRNRIIAALCDVLIVVESAEKGGSIITTEYANSYSRDIFAVPGRLTDRMSAGCNKLIKTHKAHLFQTMEDVAYICRWDTQPVQRSLNFMCDLDPDEQLIVDIIRKNSPAGLDLIFTQSDLPLPSIASVLLNLEIRGLIKSKPGKKYILV